MQRNVLHFMARTATGLLMVTALGLASLVHAQTPAQTPTRTPPTSTQPQQQTLSQAAPPVDPHLLRLFARADLQTETDNVGARRNASVLYAVIIYGYQYGVLFLGQRALSPRHETQRRCVSAQYPGLIDRRRFRRRRCPGQRRSLNGRPPKRPCSASSICITLAINDAGSASRHGARARADCKAAAERLQFANRRRLRSEHFERPFASRRFEVRVDGREFAGVQLQFRARDGCRALFDASCFRNREHARLLQHPCERHLKHRDAARIGNVVERRALRQARVIHGTVCHRRHVVGGKPWQQVEFRPRRATL